MDGKRVLIVGESKAPAICAKLLDHVTTKHARADTLGPDDVAWSELILVIENEHRRMIAERYPDEYLLRRVISLNVPERRAENQQALRSMIEEQLINHGLLRAASGSRRS